MANRKGIRLTCPTCSRSNFFTLDQIRAVEGFLYCQRHGRPVRLIDLAEVIRLAVRSQEKREKVR